MRFIETLFGISPDNGSGATELAIFLVFSALVVVISWLYRSRGFRRKTVEQHDPPFLPLLDRTATWITQGIDVEVGQLNRTE